MASLGGDHTGCSVLIYDPEGHHLGNTIVTSHDRRTLRVEVEQMPAALDVGKLCRLLILSSPSPCEYQGRIVGEGARRVVALFQGREKENRASVRYRVNYSAHIENLICDNRACPLHTPLEVAIINISKSGMRIRAPFNSLLNGDIFQIRMKLSSNEKLLIAVVTNHKDHSGKRTDMSEYGCRFLIGS